jgi:hypothetical protein
MTAGDKNPYGIFFPKTDGIGQTRLTAEDIKGQFTDHWEEALMDYNGSIEDANELVTIRLWDLHHFVKLTTSFSRGRCSLISARSGIRDAIISTTWLRAGMTSSRSRASRCGYPKLRIFMSHFVALLHPKRPKQALQPTTLPFRT